MRIISGKYKGRVFNSKLPTGIRPTQDAMRETIFNILNNYIDFENKIVADVCAGAGMLGLEAISRGASFVYFVDKNRKSIEHIQNNLNSVNVEKEIYKLLNLDAVQFINHSEYFLTPSLRACSAISTVHRKYQGIPHQVRYDGVNSKTNSLDLIFIDPPYNTNIVNDALHFTVENNIMNTAGIIIAESAIHYQILLPNGLEKITERQFGASKITFLMVV